MEVVVDLVIHYMGRWVFSPSLSYVDGECEVVENFDIDCLSYPHLMKKYTVQLGCSHVKSLFVLEPGKTLSDGLFLIEDDNGIKILMQFIINSSSKSMLHIYGHDSVDLPHSPINGLLGNSETQNSQIGTQVTYTIPGEIDVGGGSKVTQLSQFKGSWGDNPIGQLYDGIEASVQFDCGDEIDQLSVHEIIDVDIIEGDVSLGSESIVHNVTTDEESDESEDDDDDDENSDDDEIHEDNFAMTRGLNITKHNADDPNPHFMLGMTFKDANEAREAISRYGTSKGYDLKLRPNEPSRIRVKCKGDDCKFELFISKESKVGGLILKKLIPEHNCYQVFKNSLASSKFLAKEFKEKLYKNPSTKVKDLVLEAESRMKLNVSHAKCKRAKRMIINELDGSYVIEFSYLEAYAAAIKRANPYNAAEIDLCKEGLRHGKRIFRRMFICFNALKRGWLAGCRPIIGLDGCFLKGIVKGQVLVAVGKDAQDQIYPIAWAVVDKENKVNWKWFLQWLTEELQLEFGNKLTLISDMQKGLLQAAKEVLLNAEHRWCARHVEANWSKKWHSEELKKRFWICAWSTYEEEFCDNLKLLGEVSEKATEDLMKYPPKAWSRAFISSRCKSNAVDNNLCESFNSTILAARQKLIVSMLEDIRKGAMERMATRKISIDKWRSDWSPTCMDMFQDNKKEAFGSIVLFNGAQGYEVSDGDDTHTVYLDKQLCTCRVWDTTGIPCPHAIKALEHSKINPLSQISLWYHKDAYIATYQFAMEPMPGNKFMHWDEYEPIDPPPITKMPGRPRKKRVRGKNERLIGQRSGKLSRKGTIIRCGNCQGEGHDKNTCIMLEKGNPNETGAGTFANAEAETYVPTNVAGTYSKDKSKQPVSKSKPGLRTERIIYQARDENMTDIDMFRLSLPNEKELRQSNRNSKSPGSNGSRRIVFVGDGLESVSPVEVPFKAPGLLWNGQTCMTTRQLQEKKQQLVNKQSKSNNCA